MRSEQVRWVILIVLALIWGSSFILMKKALVHLDPVQVGALRMIFTSAVLIPAGYKGLSRINRKQWVYIVITALVGTFFPVFLFAFAVQNIDSSIVSILNSLTPLNTLLVGALFFGFRIGEISCPTMYCPEASSISFGRSIKYGLGVLKTAFAYRLQKLNMVRLPMFDSQGRKLV